VGKELVATVNQVLRSAGVQGSQLKILPCGTDKKEYCPLAAADKGRFKQRLSTAQDLFEFVNKRLELNPALAKKRGDNPARLFHPLAPQWILVDLDDKAGPDGILRQDGNGWELHMEGDRTSPALSPAVKKLAEDFLPALTERREGLSDAELLQKITEAGWKHLTAKLTPQDFIQGNFAFEMKRPQEAALPPFISPFHEITLRGYPGITVPWSDPYLLREWERFLHKAGVEIEISATLRRYESGEMRKENERKTYRIKGYTFLEIHYPPAESENTAWKLRYLNPLGGVIKEIEIPMREKPSVRVYSPTAAEADSSLYQVMVYNRPLKVWAYFPSKMPAAEKLSALREAGEKLQQIPEATLAPMLNGLEREKPISLYFFNDREQAKQVGITVLKNIQGQYEGANNQVAVVLNEEGGISFSTLYHEVAGHAAADFMIPQDKLGYINDPSHSALRDYYLWKLRKAFNPKELKPYHEWVVESESLKQEEKPDEKKIRELEERLKPYREKISQYFISSYAAEGITGFLAQLRRPFEDLTEVTEYLYSGTISDLSLYSEEPLLVLAGLHHLMAEYGVPRIGGIGRQEVFSHRAFKKVLGIDLQGMERVATEYEKVLDTGLSEKNSAVSAQRDFGVTGRDTAVSGPPWYHRPKPALRLNLAMGLQSFFSETFEPRLGGKLGLEYGNKKVPLLRIHPRHRFNPLVYYSVVGTHDEAGDALAAGIRYYNPTDLALEASVGVGNLLLNGKDGEEHPPGLAASFSAPWYFRILGGTFNAGPNVNYLHRGKLKDSLYGGIFLGL
jgi:hypothetical protein